MIIDYLLKSLFIYSYRFYKVLQSTKISFTALKELKQSLKTQTFLKLDVDDFLSTPSNEWDRQIAFTPKEVSQMLSVPLSTVYDLCYNGRLKAFKIGTHWRIHRKGLYEFLKHSIDTSIIL